ncbi:MAG: helix-turn-helix transcriptional regulator [Reyranella sp.]|nr:helix-turn-helix transcriptional regulator [Reyranella sp.]
METVKRDPEYIAKQLKLLRKMFGLTQDALAEASGLTTRTIEKVESGRHRPEEQTLRSLARALKMDVKVFQKPNPQEETRARAAMERAIRKMVLVRTTPIHTASDFLGAFENRHAFRVDQSQVITEDALDVVAAMTDWVRDLNDVWVDCDSVRRLEYARSFADLCTQLEEHGYLCHMGSHRQRLHHAGKPDLVFDVGLMSIQAASGAAGTRYALVELEGDWETLEKDRMALPPDFFEQ